MSPKQFFPVGSIFVICLVTTLLISVTLGHSCVKTSLKGSVCTDTGGECKSLGGHCFPFADSPIATEENYFCCCSETNDCPSFQGKIPSKMTLADKNKRQEL